MCSESLNIATMVERDSKVVSKKGGKKQNNDARLLSGRRDHLKTYLDN